MFAVNPFAIDKPAGSSAPEFNLEPEDSSSSVFCNDVLVKFSWFSADIAVTLFRMLSDMESLLLASLRSRPDCRSFPRGPLLSTPLLSAQLCQPLVHLKYFSLPFHRMPRSLLPASRFLLSPPITFMKGRQR